MTDIQCVKTDARWWKGKTKVLEQGHTLILGWNDRILSLVQQVCEANISEGGLPIVILAPKAHSPLLAHSRSISLRPG